MKLPFMPETWTMAGPVLAAAALLLYGGARWDLPWLTAFGVLVLVIAFLVLNFFRDFERSPKSPLGPKDVISPADGKIVILGTAVEGFYLKEPCLQIAVFMNPLNNHVQRAPYDGKVTGREYHPGEFLAAYDDKADLKNEQAHLVVETETGQKMVIKQIAGLLCRRVKTTPSVGDRIVRGERIGRILLGSRVDLFLPLSFKPAVKLGDQVRAGMTVLGEWS